MEKPLVSYSRNFWIDFGCNVCLQFSPVHVAMEYSKSLYMESLASPTAG